jgi:hypothetical protein
VSVIVFLDIDGVLNSGQWFDAGKPGALTDDRPGGLSFRDGKMVPRPPSRISIDPAAVVRLNPLADAGARFVLSSAWRHGFTGPEMTALLRRLGFTGEVIDRTKRDAQPAPGSLIRAETRGAQVFDWLVKHRYSGPYVIFDDDGGPEYWAPVYDSLIQTEFEFGIQPEHVDRALRMLRWEESGATDLSGA